VDRWARVERPLRPEERSVTDIQIAREVRRLAVIRVLSDATDAADGAERLSQLGLDPREGRAELAHQVNLPLGVVYGMPPTLNESRKRPTN
jgi:hypothetical protein